MGKLDGYTKTKQKEYNKMGKTFREKLKTDTILLDGAFGTYAHRLGLEDDYYDGKVGCMEYLSFSRPDFIEKIHNDYLAAGSDAVETNTFGGNILKLAEYGLADKVYDINLKSTELARKAADKHSTPENPRYVVGSMGPTGKLPSSTDPSLGDISYAELKNIFYDQAKGIIDGGADALLVETGQDILEMKAAISGARKAIEEKGKDLALMAQCTLANNGRMLLGTEISAFLGTMGALGVDVIGLNCSTGPQEMEKALAFLSANAPSYISCLPNAGLPIEEDGKTVYTLGPDEMAKYVKGFVSKYKVDVIGGCCGTGPEHIQKMREVISRTKKRKPSKKHFYASFYKGFDLEEINRPVKVGERINTQGSRKMKDLLLADDYDGIIELGKLQQRQGSDMLDVCSVLTERQTEERDSVIITKRLAESVQVPLMIDSTDAEVIEKALSNYPGTAFVNSVNLEDGGIKAGKIFALAKEHGAFVVNLLIDEKGMAKSLERKLEIAGRLYDIATEDYGLEPHRLLFDMLTFTLGTGEEEYRDAAINTCKAIKTFKKTRPGVLTVLGVSNISFGLGKSARKVLNMVFLHHAVKAGLDMTIINPAEFVDYKDIPAKERRLAEELVLNKHSDALNRYVEYFAQLAPVKADASPTSDEKLTARQRLEKCIFDRDKINIIPLVDEAMKEYPAEVIINEILMNAMKQVGDKLDSGEMVLPYVLQSAEVMKKAIDHLEEFLPKNSASSRGKVLLATVSGDVHDIGKNLVKMILVNNGFSVIDLGKQVPIETIVAEAKKNHVDAIGLSALLVSTARHMKTCVQSMHDAGLDYPILIGGAPTNKRFAKEISALKDDGVYKGGVFYARDAFTGLQIMQAVSDASKREEIMEGYHKQFDENSDKVDKETSVSIAKEGKAKNVAKVPSPPFYGARSVSNIPADEVFSHINQHMLFDITWGSKLKSKEERVRFIEEEYKPLLHELKEEVLRKGWLDLKAVYGYFKCRVEGELLEILDESGSVIETMKFPAQKDGTSLIDYIHEGSEGHDIVAFQAVTVGDKINDAIGHFNDSNESTHAFYLHGFSVNIAEALAAYMHDKIRGELGVAKGQGKRYSPGYPLWKDLADQKKLFKLLDIENRIGIRLTEGYQMIPEQSTTAMIIYNKKASY